jgi:NAD(P)-dependent dehydrogenase (short-subunit alcohol dehydrogenase family)
VTPLASELAATAIVTGGADGIGAAIARRFLAAGHAVHICDNRPEPLAAMLQANPGMSGSVADVGRRDDVLALFAEAGEAFGTAGLGTLVNNVGIGGPRAALEDIDPADWEESLRVNATGTFHCMQAAVRAMKPRGGGAIINISTVSTRTRLPLRTPYIASKFAVEGLTLNGARELGRHGIRCNALLPGMMNNARMDGIIARRAREEGRDPAAIEAEFLRFIALGQRTEPEEVAETAFFLASPAGARITGELISVSGGMGWEE